MYLVLTPQGGHAARVRALRDIINCEYEGIWPAQPSDAIQVMNKQDYERATAKKLALFDWRR